MTALLGFSIRQLRARGRALNPEAFRRVAEPREGSLGPKVLRGTNLGQAGWSHLCIGRRRVMGAARNSSRTVQVNAV